MRNNCKIYRRKTSCIMSAVLLILLLFSYFPLSKANTTDSRIALLGDSMTWIGGDSCDIQTGWSHVLKESGIYEHIDVYARSGATWTNTSSTKRDTEFYSEILHDDNVLYNQVLRLIDESDSGKTEPETILIFAGANDAWFSERRPGIFDTPDPLLNQEYSLATSPAEVTSLAGSVSLICDLIKNRFPDSILILVTPLQMSKVPADTTFKVADIIGYVGKEKGCIIMRADRESGINHDDEVAGHKFTYDGVHTNPKGAEIVGNYIINNLLKIKNPDTDNN